MKSFQQLQNKAQAPPKYIGNHRELLITNWKRSLGEAGIIGKKKAHFDLSLEVQLVKVKSLKDQQASISQFTAAKPSVNWEHAKKPCGTKLRLSSHLQALVKLVLFKAGHQSNYADFSLNHHYGLKKRRRRWRMPLPALGTQHVGHGLTAVVPEEFLLLSFSGPSISRCLPLSEYSERLCASSQAAPKPLRALTGRSRGGGGGGGRYWYPWG